jgi:cysteine desulfurase
MLGKVIYLDNASTTRMQDDVVNKMINFYTEDFYNPSSIYSSSQRIRTKVEECRALVATTLNAKNNEIFFTSCGSESDNWALKGIALAYALKGKHIITSKIEHHAVLNSAKVLEKNGFDVTYLDVDENGIVDIEALEKNIRKDTILVSIMYANNEIGIIEPISQIGSICKKHNIIFHTDAVQAYAHVNIDVNKENIDLLSAAGHKFGGPKGIGFLYKRSSVNIKNIIEGGSQEMNKRAGTENVAGIIGMSEAAKKAFENIDNTTKYEKELRDYSINRILTEIPYCRLNGDKYSRLSNNINISFNFIEGESLLLLLNKYGICASTGSACTSNSLEPSHVLLAIGLPHEVAHGSLRLTLSSQTTKEEMDFVIDKIKDSVNILRQMSPLYEDFIKNNK